MSVRAAIAALALLAACRGRDATPVEDVPVQIPDGPPVTITGGEGGSFVVTWPAVEGVARYEVDGRLDGSEWASLGRFPSAGVTGQWTDWADGAVLELKVKCVVTSGGDVRSGAFGPTSAPYSFPVRQPGPDLVATLSPAALHLAWVPNARVLDGVRIYRAFVDPLGARVEREPVELPPMATTYDEPLPALTDGRGTVFRVVNHRHGHESKPSREAFGKFAPILPPVFAATAEDGAVRLSWAHRSDWTTAVQFQRWTTASGRYVEYPVYAKRGPAEGSVLDRVGSGFHRYQTYSWGPGGGDGPQFEVFVPPFPASPALTLETVRFWPARRAFGSPDEGFSFLSMSDFTFTYCPLGGSQNDCIGHAGSDFDASVEPGVANAADGRPVAVYAVFRGVGVRRLEAIHRTESSVELRTLADLPGAVQGLSVSAAGGAAQAAWWDAAGVRWASSSSGFQAEPVDCGVAGMTNGRWALASDAGAPVLLLRADTLRLAWREAGAWRCEETGIAPGPAGAAVAVLGAGQEATLFDLVPSGTGTLRVVAYTRQAGAFGPPELIDEVPEVAESRLVAVAGPGGRLALLVQQRPTELAGAQRDALYLGGAAGGWTSHPILATSNAEVGFDAGGKAWVLQGLDERYDAYAPASRLYALFRER